MDLVSIVIPTLDRPRCLERAVRSALAQTTLDDTEIEVVVVDNSVGGSAGAVVSRLQAIAGGRLRWVGEPSPGVATARNAGVGSVARGWIAFLDDDEEAVPTWIAGLIAVARASGADAVFGPVEARADQMPADLSAAARALRIAPFAAFFSRRIDRPDGADVTDLAPYLGTNNSMFDRRRCLAAAEPFDTDLNETGGEDSLLLKQLAMDGRHFAWASAAAVVEWVPARRLNWSYVWRRKFLSGQIRVFVLAKVRPARWAGIVGWMGIGGVQFIAAGLGGLAVLPFDRRRALALLATAAGGLGKVLWAPWFRARLYGTRLVS